MAKRPTINTLANTAAPSYLTELNQNFANVRNQFDNTLSLDGSTPNAMNADIDLNGNDLINSGTVYAGEVVVDGVALATQVSNAAASASSAAASADTAALYTPAYFEDVTALLADIRSWPTGQILNTRKEGFAYEVASSGASDQHVTTAGGVKLYVQPINAAYPAAAFGAKGDNATDDATAINAAVGAAESAGGGAVVLNAGTYIVGATIALADNVTLHGAGQKATTIKLKNSANTNIIAKKGGSTGFGAGLFDLTVDGNDTNNTSGGIYWAGASTGRGPSFTFERVKVTKCRPIASPPSSEYGAILTTGSTWGVARDLDVDQNQYAVGWWHRGSDWQITNLYIGPNGASYGGTGTHSFVLQGGAGNILTSCYFGGNGGLSQVFLWGADRNLFVNCVNDNAWESAYKLSALTGSGSDNNRFLGGQVRGASGKTNAGFAAVVVEDSSGNIFSDVEWSGNAHTTSGFAASYGLQETGTSTGNYIVGGNLPSNFQTNFVSLGGSSTTMVTSVFGYDSSDTQIATVKKRVNVVGPYDGSAPSTSTTPKLRVNNGGAISLWADATAYSYAWMQGIQDDGSNTLKPIRINPLGGGVVIGGNLEPINDNTQTLGGSGSRWSVVYAGTGTINTSDEREKQQIQPIDAAALRAWARVEYCQFKFNDAVEAKSDGARWHFGVIAQRVKEAFEAEGLDPFGYGVLCYDEWPATEDRPAGNRYGIRYEEALALECAYLRSRLA